MRIEQGITDAGLRSQVDDTVEAVRGKQFGRRRTIGNIALLKMEVRVSGELRYPRPLQVGVIEGIEVVERDDGAAVGQQTSRDVKADKASRPNNKNRPHPGFLSAQSDPTPKKVQTSAITADNHELVAVPTLSRT
jgi:hypothetical protein